MGFRSKITQRYVHVFTLVVCLQLCGSDGEDSGLRIFRDEQDIFTNMKCSGQSKSFCTPDQCEMYGAECVSDDNCKYCRCLKGRNTFLYFVRSNDEAEGNCTRDEDIVPESVPNERFWLQNIKHGKCLKPKPEDGYIIGTNCSSRSLEVFWVWTGTSNKKQLMNVKTLQCMETQKQNNKNVQMKPCQKSLDLQTVSCTSTYGQSQMKISWKSVPKNLWSFDTYYLHLRRNHYVFSKRFQGQKNPQQWNSDNNQPCDTKITYKGCYRFSDSTFMKYLNYSGITPELQIFAPIFANDGQCIIDEQFRFIRQGKEWKTHTDTILSIEKVGQKMTLKFASMEKLKRLNGSLLHLSVQCGNENHCVLLKLASLPSFTDAITRTPPSFTTTMAATEPTTGYQTTTSYEPTTEYQTTTTYEPTTEYESKTTYEPTTTYTTISSSSNSMEITTFSTVSDRYDEISSTPLPTRQMSTTDNTYEGISDEASESSSTNSAAIAVPIVLLLVALALALGFFVWCRKRKREQMQQNKKNEMGVAYYSKDTYEDPDRTYETLTENGNGVLHNQTELSHDINNHLYRNTIANPASSEQEYTYSQDTHFPRSGVGTNNAVYHTLEQPEQQTDDGTYSYLDNTTIANPPSSELEYTYARDTDLPSATGTNTAAKSPANNPLYNTLEQPEQPDDGSYSYPDTTSIGNPPPEMEYTYAKDTELPRASVDTAAKDPASNAVYHTLEQPEQQPDDGSYSYPDNTSIEKPPAELEYTYAKGTDLPRVNVHTAVKDPTSNAVYHTLEQPEQQPDDGSYSYPDNTTVTNQGSPELEYTYAKDTDTPRATADTKSVSLGKSAPVNNGVEYHNLEQDEPVPAENEYSYATNTEIPSIDKSTPPKTNALSTVPDKNDLHLTPEELNPSQAPVYSTLEEAYLNNSN